jgi:hypothetical protein
MAQTLPYLVAGSDADMGLDPSGLAPNSREVNVFPRTEKSRERSHERRHLGARHAIRRDLLDLE